MFFLSSLSPLLCFSFSVSISPLFHLSSCSSFLVSASLAPGRRNVETRAQSGPTPTPTLAYRRPFNSPSLPFFLLVSLSLFYYHPFPSTLHSDFSSTSSSTLLHSRLFSLLPLGGLFIFPRASLSLFLSCVKVCSLFEVTVPSICNDWRIFSVVRLFVCFALNFAIFHVIDLLGSVFLIPTIDGIFIYLHW